MTPAEREMLLKLWEDVPETALKGFRFGERGAWWHESYLGNESSIPEDLVAAIARDAMVGYVRSAVGMVTLKENNIGPKLGKRFQVFVGMGPIETGDTQVLALISACRKVAAKNSAGKDSA